MEEGDQLTSSVLLLKLKLIHLPSYSQSFQDSNSNLNSISSLLAFSLAFSVPDSLFLLKLKLKLKLFSLFLNDSERKPLRKVRRCSTIYTAL